MSSFQDAQSKVTFIKTLCGKYSNKEQAYNQPKLFAHINIYFRILPWELFKSLGVYSEQSYDYAPWSPYRQAVHKLSIRGKILILENYALINPKRLAGAGFELSLLKELKFEALSIRNNCEMNFIQKSNGVYKGNLQKESRYLITKNGKKTFLKSQVEFTKDTFQSLDEGYDINTGKKIWGSKHGYLRFKKV